MNCAYNEMYLTRARETMGAMLDYAVWDSGTDIDYYFDLFLASGLADRFGNGDPSVIAGKSGPEIVWDVFAATGYSDARVKPRYNLDRSREYWTGWIMAHYQWRTVMPFREIAGALPPSRIRSFYSPFHERDPRAFVEKADMIYLAAKTVSNLKSRREASGMTQGQLADASGVPLRTIQQYEQRRKDIRKAGVGQVLAMSRALGCRLEDILEFAPRTAPAGLT